MPAGPPHALGDWEQIESYVRAHSDAEFSHGICPECIETYYPESAFLRAMSPRGGESD